MVRERKRRRNARTLDGPDRCILAWMIARSPRPRQLRLLSGIEAQKTVKLVADVMLICCVVKGRPSKD